ncbi:uncharacterized protein BDV14DRAFT_201620 [Aspergillus stella-maris]|uniref:uncharacterized protein n=1 Tax=Aspergillus stella-maris TaxID=1810926 RepID=UPI003CCD9B59
MSRGAYGTFICRNVEDPRDATVMRILMQVPYEVSELAMHAEHARQADTNLSGRGLDELEPLQTITEANVTLAPHIRHLVQATQGDNGLAPGGFLYYILLEHAPGEELDEEKFWARSKMERARICEAFKVSWLYFPIRSLSSFLSIFQNGVT